MTPRIRTRRQAAALRAGIVAASSPTADYPPLTGGLLRLYAAAYIRTRLALRQNARSRLERAYVSARRFGA